MRYCATLLAALVMLVGPPARKPRVDPEPPRRSPVGDWVGDNGGETVVAHFSRNGLYHENYDGEVYSGCWRAVPGKRLKYVVEEYTVPGKGTWLPAMTLVHYTLTPDGKSLSSDAGTEMKRYKP